MTQRPEQIPSSAGELDWDALVDAQRRALLVIATAPRPLSVLEAEHVARVAGWALGSWTELPWLDAADPSRLVMSDATRARVRDHAPASEVEHAAFARTTLLLERAEAQRAAHRASAQAREWLAEHAGELAAWHVRWVLARPELASRCALAASWGWPEHARELGDSAVDLAAASAAPSTLARALAERASRRLASGQPRLATHDLRRALGLARDVVAAPERGRLLVTLGAAERRIGELEQAQLHLVEGLELGRALGDEGLQAAALTALGDLRVGAGVTDRAAMLFERAASLVGASDDPLLGEIAIGRARVATATDRIGDARRQLAVALAIAERNAEPALLMSALLSLAMLDHAEGDAAAAERGYARAREACGAWGEPLVPTSLLVHAALVALSRRGGAAALDGMLEAEQSLAGEASTSDRALVEAHLALLYGARGAVADARAHYARARVLAEELDDAAALGVVDVVAHHLRGAPPPSPRGPAEQRVAALAARLLTEGAATPGDRRAPLAAAPSDAQPEAQPCLHVALDQATFKLPGDRRVDLSRHPTLWRILRALVAARLATPGRAVPPRALAQTVWTDASVAPEEAANRLYVGVSTLRRLGLRGALITGPEGYLLDPGIEVRIGPATEVTP